MRPSAVVLAAWQTICIQMTFFLAFDGHFYERWYYTVGYADITSEALMDAEIQSCSHLHSPPVIADANQEAFIPMCCKWKMSNTRPCSSSTADGNHAVSWRNSKQNKMMFSQHLATESVCTQIQGSGVVETHRAHCPEIRWRWQHCRETTGWCGWSVWVSETSCGCPAFSQIRLHRP